MLLTAKGNNNNSAMNRRNHNFLPCAPENWAFLTENQIIPNQDFAHNSASNRSLCIFVLTSYA